jgi:hypothetical protein
MSRMLKRWPTNHEAKAMPKVRPKKAAMRLFSPVAVVMVLAPAAMVLLALIITRLLGGTHETPSYSDCASIEEAASRLACYDTVAAERHIPAKAGIAAIPGN